LKVDSAWTLIAQPVPASTQNIQQISGTTAQRIKDIKADAAATYGSNIYNWEPKLPKLPNVSMPMVNLTGATVGQDTFANLAAWW